MTKPIRLEEFDKENARWKNRENLPAGKAGSEVSWKINLTEVIEKAVQNAEMEMKALQDSILEELKKAIGNG